MNFLMQFIHQQNALDIEAAVLQQGLEIERALLKKSISASGPTPAEVHQIPMSGGNTLRPPTSLEKSILLELFDTHRGFIPPFELLAHGFDIPDLIARGLIIKSECHLDGGCYLIGSELRKAVQYV